MEKKTNNTFRPPETSKTRMAKNANAVLLCVTFALAGIIAIGTIIGLVRGKGAPLVIIGKAAPEQTEESYFYNDDIRVFSGIGRLRIPLADSSVLILSVSFPYKADDIAFQEELAQKINDFKTIAIDYFSSLPNEEINHINEDAAKQEILNQYNSILRLGQIPALYFNDMILLAAD